MHPLINAFWQIVLFRQGPQNLPDSQLLLLLAAGLYALVSFMAAVAGDFYDPEIGVTGSTLATAIVYMVVEVPYQWLFLLLILAYFGNSGRFRQSMTAVFGTGSLLGILIFPLTALAALSESLTTSLPGLALVSILISVVGLIGATLWSLAVYGHILSQAISRSFGLGVACAFLNFVIDYQLYILLPDF